MPEQVLVVPRVRLLPHGGFHGFSREGLSAYLTTIEGHAFFAPRDRVEEDASLKQIIPYVILRHDARIFLVERTRGGSEARLRDKLSIGLGGHINPGDGDRASDRVAAGMERELTEEVELPAGWRAKPIGLLNDDVEAVGRVHFGLVYVADLPSPDVRVRETSKLAGAFATREEIRAAYPRLESWSQFVVDGVDLLEV
ncbi:MAG TPA: phosphoesterase [bacterium]|nr:phosphoesterase [bacterium]